MLFLGHESFREMVREAVGDSVSLQEEIVALMNNVNETAECLYWADYYNISEDKRPLNIKKHAVKGYSNRYEYLPIESSY